MSWKTLIIKEFDKVVLKQQNLLVQKQNHPDQKIRVSIDDLNCVVFENNYTLLSNQVINRLINNNVNVIFTNDRHDPNCVVLPLAGHCLPLKNLSLQLKTRLPLKHALWKLIIENKIANQITVMQLTKQDHTVIERCTKLLHTVAPDDVTNREGIVAKMFYRAMYGSSFIRFNDDMVNKVLNYGYKIMVSALSRTIVKFGLNLFLGIKHKGPSNPFNLSYDVVESYRPVVDLWIWEHWDELNFTTDRISYLQRLQLINLLNLKVQVDDKVMTVNSSFNVVVQSLITALQKKDPTRLKRITIPTSFTTVANIGT